MPDALSGLPRGVSESLDFKKPITCKINQYGSIWNRSEVNHTSHEEIESMVRWITHLNNLNEKEKKSQVAIKSDIKKSQI